MINTVEKLITALKTGRTRYAEAAMEFPKTEPFEHGVQVGVYRGLGMALDEIDKILSEAEVEEARL